MTNHNIIEHAIGVLGYKEGQFVDLRCISQSSQEWLEHGDLIAAAQKAGAESIFFVQNNPVIVFAKCAEVSLKISTYNRLWCLARPRILFLECEGELSVIDMAQAPIRITQSTEQEQLKTLEILSNIKDVVSQLQEFHRDNVESGKVFENKRFGNATTRADRALIADLKVVRKELINANLPCPKAHALIGRSIFIRYLEDRGILTKEYFVKIASQSNQWQDMLDNPYSREHLDFSGISALYPRVLQDKAFTYALFRSLATDFNGDMFPNIEQEETLVEERHLRLIQDLLYGDVGAQKKLFFFCYSFDVIPLDLISSIYEEFYHRRTDQDMKQSKARENGVYYTPPVLAEFVVSRILTPDVLKSTPRVLDPACGSGIFLVEAFRRIVRYRIGQREHVPSFSELKEILGKQIAGIEINEEAARITAFSLYLAMLHYLDPPSIMEQISNGNRLPNLIVSNQSSSNHYDCIHIGNAFAIPDEHIGEVDIIIGNPPWGSPGRKASKEAKDHQDIMLKWCNVKKYPIGDKEPSQAFLWRATDLLKPEGQCALLTSAGVLLKHSSTSQAFRRKWMGRVRLIEVFNFTHVRKFFFQGAISPFVLIQFQKAEQGNCPVEYWSPKQTYGVKETQAIILSIYDRNFIDGQDLTDNKPWKVNWFGRRADALFVEQLSHYRRLTSIVDRGQSGQGYKKNPAEFSFEELKQLPSLDISSFCRYAKLSFETAPDKFHRAGIVHAYRGNRILIKRGIQEKTATKGILDARFVTDDFCFTNAINGIKLKESKQTCYIVLLGIIWSSFSRYFYFNISANWGLWHHEIHLDDELLQLPIPAQLSGTQADKVIAIVQKLRSYDPQAQDLIHPDGIPQAEIERQRREWEAELDEAVFDLYGFSDEQRDLIRDCCEVTLPFFYQPLKSIGAMPAVKSNGRSKGTDFAWMQEYADIFSLRWKPYLNEGEVMRADLHLGASSNMIAMEFYPADPGDPWELTPQKDTWSHLLDEIGKALPRPLGTSQILLNGLVHVVTNNGIIVIKRNEKRFWTRSLAREDADATLCKAMKSRWTPMGGRNNGPKTIVHQQLEQACRTVSQGVHLFSDRTDDLRPHCQAGG
jgi:hypothetical protein